jgi:hypothetical protein
MAASAILMMAVVEPRSVVVPPVIVINRVTVVRSLPVLHMTGRHVYIDRPGNNHGCGPDHDRMSVSDRVRVNDRRRNIANV